jgi:hypothetical protein
MENNNIDVDKFVLNCILNERNEFPFSYKFLSKYQLILDNIKSHWEYNGRLFSIAQENIGITPPIIPIIYKALKLNENLFADWKNTAKYALESKKMECEGYKYKPEEYITSRFFQFQVGVARELECVIDILTRFKNKIFLLKDFKKDLEKGIDFTIFQYPSYKKITTIAIYKDGKTSDEYNDKKKRYKSKDVEFVLKTGKNDRNNNGIHFVGKNLIPYKEMIKKIEEFI